MKAHLTHKELHSNIDSVTKAKARDWTAIGRLLDHVEITGYWKEQAASYSDWLKLFASRLGLGEASLWRYLASARYYDNVKPMLISRGLQCPPIENLPRGVSPEKLELLSKLARAAPDDVLHEVASRVIKGCITRAEMRRTWEAYRPVLGGRTARGTGTEPPKADPSDPEQFDSIVEARVFTALAGSGPAWTGLTRPYLYKIFHAVGPEFDNHARQRFVFDAVVVTRNIKWALSEYHGIEILGVHLLRQITF